VDPEDLPVDHTDADGWTPLFHVAGRDGGCGAALLRLLGRGADPNHRAKNGDTVLDVLYAGCASSGEHQTARENERLLRAHGYRDPRGRGRTPPAPLPPPSAPPRSPFATALAPGARAPRVQIETVSCMGEKDHLIEVSLAGHTSLVLTDDPDDVWVTRDGSRVYVDPSDGQRRAYDLRAGFELLVTPWPAPADLVPVRVLAQA
jgi:hypothetical protein